MQTAQVSYRLLSGRAGFQMILKPVEREVRDTVERTRLFKQVGRAGDDLQPMLRSGWKLRDGRAVQGQHHSIVPTDNKQAGRRHLTERRASEIRPASAGHH